MQFSDAAKDGYAAGLAAGREWIGPNGNGSLGALSLEFVREAAERHACGHRFAELTDEPTTDEQAAAGGYITGFWEGREAALS